MHSLKPVFDEDDFISLVNQNTNSISEDLTALNSQINADYLFLGVRVKQRVKVLVSVSKEAPLDDFSYSLVGSPCEHVLAHGACGFSNAIQTQFPHDEVLKRLNGEAYLGAGVFNENNENVGILVALYCSEQSAISQWLYGFATQAKLIGMHIQKRYLEMCTNHHLALLEEVSDISNTGAWEYYPDEERLYWSAQTYRIHGLPIGHPISPQKAMSFYSLASQAEIKKAFSTLLNDKVAYDQEFQIVDSQGQLKWVRTSGKAQLNSEGVATRYYGAFEDITEFKKTVAISEERALRIQNILNSINDAVISVNANGIICHCNAVASRIFGYSIDELISQPIELLMPEPYASNHKKYMYHYEKTGNARIMGVGRQLPAKRKDGSVFQMELSLSESADMGEKRYVGVIRDISERIEAQDTIYNLAYTDSVTHLRNSQWFQKEFQDLILRSAMRNEYVHVMLLDMDNMAQINTRLGFINGNKALQVIAEKLLFIIGHDYELYKFTNDRFIVLSSKTYRKEELHRFEPALIENALLNPRHFEVDLEDNQWALSASLGSAIFDPKEQSFERVINVLELAVKRAKSSAPFGLCHVSSDGIEEFDRYVAIKTALKGAIENDELSLALQPQVDQNGALTSFEALVRWHSPELGIVSPADFIPIAEESHAICEIGQVVLDKTLEALRSFISRGMDASIAINISARQIVLPDFTSSLLSKVTQYAIAPQLLMLELTETALVADIQLVKQTMLELARYGFRFSVDDFGTGYSSLAYLKELPISELKIDKFFVDDICEENSGKASQIVDAIIEMSKALKVTCIAEGVETQAQLDYLIAKGCDRFQGYYFSKPLPVEYWQNITSPTLPFVTS